jgi:phenylacetate-CoA ligase
MEVQIEVTPEVFGDTVGALEELHKKLEYALDRTLGVRVAVRLVKPHTIARSEGKAKRVTDRRNLEG